MRSSTEPSGVQRPPGSPDRSGPEAAIGVGGPVISTRVDQDAAATASLGAALQGLGRIAEAVACYRQALALAPGDAEVHNNLGVALDALKRPEEAIACYRSAITLRRDFGLAHRNLAHTLQGLGRREEAIACYREAIRTGFEPATTLYDFGTLLQQLGRNAEAVDCYRRALALDPDRLAAHVNCGNALQTLRRSAEAMVCYDRAATLDPQCAEAQNGLGAALHSLGHHEAAIVCLERAIALAPNSAPAYANHGNASLALGRLGAALASFRRALAVDPRCGAAYVGAGLTLEAVNHHEDAITCHRQAAAIGFDMRWANWNDALACLAIGDFAAGWQKYESRWLHPELDLPERRFSQPLWLGGTSVHGKTILLHWEQGLGDTLQFVRYAPLLAARGATVVLEAQTSLVALLRGMGGLSLVYGPGEEPPRFDCHCPLMSLPLAFGTTSETIPAAVPYLRAPAEALARWRSTLPSTGAPRIGLVWAGRPAHRNDRNRSIPLARLLPPLDLAKVRAFALQPELRDGDAEMLDRFAIPNLGPRLGDFADTAAAVSLLDLVITVDTSVAHLAGALGKPVWILLPFSAEWRWLRWRSDSPWYPTARLFRQPAPGDWSGAIGLLNEALQIWLWDQPAS